MGWKEQLRAGFAELTQLATTGTVQQVPKEAQVEEHSSTVFLEAEEEEGAEEPVSAEPPGVVEPSPPSTDTNPDLVDLVDVTARLLVLEKKLQSQDEATELTVMDVTGRVNGLESDLQNQKRLLDLAKTQVSDLHAALAEHDGKIAVLKDQLTDQVSLVDSLNRQVTQLTSDLNEMGEVVLEEVGKLGTFLARAETVETTTAADVTEEVPSSEPVVEEAPPAEETTDDEPHKTRRRPKPTRPPGN